MERLIHKPALIAESKLSEPRYIRNIKKGIFAYFLLLIFEGALRKWVLPGLASPLLVIRDPIALYIIAVAIQKRILNINGYLFVIVLIGFISIVTALVFGHGNIIVALYGARILLLHFPLIFIIGKVFSRADVLKLGVLTIWLAIPMALLIATQFYSPQSAWVNRGIGGDEAGAGFSGAKGFFRPPGTFSFTIGNTLFFGFVGAFVFYFWLAPRSINKFILIASTFALLMAIPLSISRSLFFQVLISLLFAGAIMLRKPKYIGKTLFSVFALALILLLLSQAPFFKTALDAFTNRFETANKSEGGVESVLLDRYLGGLWSALTGSFNNPFFGLGIGAGTNVGSSLLVGKQVFLGGEGEWGRLVAELGPLMGLSIIFVRVGLTVELVRGGYRRLSAGDVLPWMLLSLGLLTLPQGGWAQPTSLGFCTITAGLIIASLKNPGLAHKNRQQTASKLMPIKQVE